MPQSPFLGMNKIMGTHHHHMISQHPFPVGSAKPVLVNTRYLLGASYVTARLANLNEWFVAPLLIFPLIGGNEYQWAPKRSPETVLYPVLLARHSTGAELTMCVHVSLTSAI
jgi:hypothetical protein